MSILINTSHYPITTFLELALYNCYIFFSKGSNFWIPFPPSGLTRLNFLTLDLMLSHRIFSLQAAVFIL